jgi:peptide-methionine (R)-S-oxide reductase
MKRRVILEVFASMGMLALSPARLQGHEADVGRITISEEEWYDRLTYLQYSVLVMGETEDPGSSEILDEDRPGVYKCVGCDLELFRSEWKYDSNTGWPSFRDAIPAHTEEIRIGLSVIGPVEYRCARCGGHHGHVFNDGPEPTGKRYSNNGAVLVFVPDPA